MKKLEGNWGHGKFLPTPACRINAAFRPVQCSSSTRPVSSAKDLRAGGAPGLAGTGPMHQRSIRGARGLRRHQQEERSGVLSDASSHYRRLAWAGADTVVRVGLAATTRRGGSPGIGKMKSRNCLLGEHTRPRVSRSAPSPTASWFLQHIFLILGVTVIATTAPAQSASGSGHSFVCTDYTQGKVIIVSAEGKIEWETMWYGRFSAIKPSGPSPACKCWICPPARPGRRCCIDGKSRPGVFRGLDPLIR